MQSLKQHLKRLRFALLAPSLTVNPHNERRAVVYVKSKLIYNRIKKSGNSSILLFLDKIVYVAPDRIRKIMEKQRRRAFVGQRVPSTCPHAS